MRVEIHQLLYARTSHSFQVIFVDLELAERLHFVRLQREWQLGKLDELKNGQFSRTRSFAQRPLSQLSPARCKLLWKPRLGPRAAAVGTSFGSLVTGLASADELFFVATLEQTPSTRSGDSAEANNTAREEPS